MPSPPTRAWISPSAAAKRLGVRRDVERMVSWYRSEALEATG